MDIFAYFKFCWHSWITRDAQKVCTLLLNEKGRSYEVILATPLLIWLFVTGVHLTYDSTLSRLLFIGLGVVAGLNTIAVMIIHREAVKSELQKEVDAHEEKMRQLTEDHEATMQDLRLKHSQQINQFAKEHRVKIETAAKEHQLKVDTHKSFSNEETEYYTKIAKAFDTLEIPPIDNLDEIKRAYHAKSNQIYASPGTRIIDDPEMELAIVMEATKAYHLLRDFVQRQPK